MTCTELTLEVEAQFGAKALAQSLNLASLLCAAGKSRLLCAHVSVDGLSGVDGSKHLLRSST